jgi:dTDP-4-dehydrorhamnose reductase
MNKGKRILITGAGGLVGRTLTEYLERESYRNVFAFTRKDLDITDRRRVEEITAALQPDYIINCAAYTQVDKSEVEKKLCYAVNVKGTEHLAVAAARLKAVLIHLSTDYVFDGKKLTPYTEDDAANPLNYYGLTKLMSEEKVKTYAEGYFIIRPSWIYGKYGKNFFTGLMEWAKANKVLKIAGDQTGSPTFAGDLAEFILFLLSRGIKDYGTYHFSNEGAVTRYEQALEIIRLKDLSVRLEPVSSAYFKPLAVRPPYSVLSKEKIKRKFDYPVADWKDSLAKFIREYDT